MIPTSVIASPTVHDFGFCSDICQITTRQVGTCRIAGEARLNEIRDQARALAGPLSADGAFQILHALIGALLQTQVATLSTEAGIALARGEPIDTACVERSAASMVWFPYALACSSQQR